MSLDKNKRLIIFLFTIFGLFVVNILFNYNNLVLINSNPNINYQEIGKRSNVLGLSSAPIEIIEYSDFGCSYCKSFYKETLPSIKKLIDKGQVRLVYKHLVNYAQKAAEASECAGDQNKFWEYHDLIFENGYSDNLLQDYATTLNLDLNKFNQCLNSGVKTSIIKQDIAEASKKGFSGTPSFEINGIKLVGAQPFSNFQQIINQINSQ